MNRTSHILIIDDDESIRDSCSKVLAGSGYTFKTAVNGEQGLKIFNKETFHVVLLDWKLPDMDGMDLLSKIKEENPETPVIIMTGYASVESAVEAIKRGAFDYLTKPFSPKELRVTLNKALESRNLIFENIYLRTELEQKTEFDMVVGKSQAMARLMDIVQRVSATESTVLITGESGTGKELLAKEIHHRSPRRNCPFVVVDCGALVETLFESELFGHVKGSFTGAYQTKHGRFEVANGGTIFLDEISNIGMNTQSKLLRIIQDREVTRIGSSKPIKVDVRILAATNKDLAEKVREGEFREDLFYRLNVVPVHLPPLRDRKDDIPILADHFLKKYNKKAKKMIRDISPAALKALMNYDWPGNIRELENTIERAIVLSRDNHIDLNDLVYHGIYSEKPLYNSFKEESGTLQAVEKDYIRKILLKHHGNKSQTAEALGINRKTLWAKLKKYNIA